MSIVRGTARMVGLVLLMATLCVPALAHRVNIFAYVEGDKVMVDCSYSKSKRVNHGAIVVTDAKTGEELLKGETDDQGYFSFVIPQEARADKADLVIHLTAGEGHENDWEVKADEYLGAASQAAPAKASEKSGGVASQPGVAASQAGEKEASSLAAPAPVAPTIGGTCDEAAIARAVDAALETKIAPIRRILIEEKESGPGMTEIIGGIGWIFGIIGVAAYFRSRNAK